MPQVAKYQPLVKKKHKIKCCRSRGCDSLINIKPKSILALINENREDGVKLFILV